jgi:hypothetical protein
MHRLVFLFALAACGSSPAESPEPAPAEPVAAEPEAAPAPAPAAAPAGAPARGDDAERKSKNGLTELKVGDADVVVTYGRPEARGREIWGKLVPYGKVWRTGADEATVVTVSAPVMFGKTEVPAGSYALFTVPGEDQWTLMLNSQAEQWGAYDRDPGKDVAKAKAKPVTADAAEAFTIHAEGEQLFLHWGTVKVPVPLKPKA